MSHRRILSLWFPRLAAERRLRARRVVLPMPFAVVGDVGGAQVLTSLNDEASAAGLRAGQPLRDATAMCPGLVTVPADPVGDAGFLAALRRWAGKFSPWVAEEPPDSLVIDLSGCAHLFGGEAALLAEVEADCAGLGISLRAGVADTRGAAWALARYAGQAGVPTRNGDAIEQEARATRSRAVKRRGWERGGTAPSTPPGPALPQGVIAPAGGARQAIAGLPLAALRLAPDVVEGLNRLGVLRVEDLVAMPRAALARRFGAPVVRRIDQALGLDPEPVAPARAPLHFAVRISFPDPIGLASDIEAGLDRLLPVLCARLKVKARGARRVRLQAMRSDGQVVGIEIGLARPTDLADRIKPLLMLKLDQIDPGFGIDRLRLEAVQTEPLHAVQHRGHLDASVAALARHTVSGQFDDLIGKLGARLGIDAVVRLHPAESHIPEKASVALAAAFSVAHPAPWPAPATPRPLQMFRPEGVTAPGVPTPPDQFRWRRRDLTVRMAVGPERILPEWWLDNPDWRSGARDYWRIETAEGQRLWLFYAHGGEVSGGWFCQGVFA